MIVVLYKVNRNLNRSIRTCYSFGIKDLFLVDCGNLDYGNLFAAKSQVKLHRIKLLPDFGYCALENFYSASIYDINWDSIEAILIGGESDSLKKKELKNLRHQPVMAKIPTKNDLCLTVEASLAIALSEWNRNAN